MSTVNGFQVGSETLKYNYESLDNYNTPNFSTSFSKTYAVGDYVMYNGKLYKCTTVTTGGTWVSGNWTEAVLSDDVSDLKNTKAPVIINAVSGDYISFVDGDASVPFEREGLVLPITQTGEGEPSLDNRRAFVGFADCDISQTGKNLLEVSSFTSTTQNGVNITRESDGKIRVTGLCTAYTDFGTLAYATLPAGEYIISGIKEPFYRMSVYDSDDVYIGGLVAFSTEDPIYELKFTVEKQDTYHVKFIVGNRSDFGKGIVLEPMIRNASDASGTFKPYQYTAYNVTWEDEYGLVYCGELNAESKQLTVTHLAHTLNDVGQVAKSGASMPEGRSGYYLRVDPRVPTQHPWLADMKKVGGGDNPNNVVCYSDVYDIGNKDAYDVAGLSTFAIALTNYGQYSTFWFNVSATDCPDEGAFVNYINNLAPIIVYPLETPIVIDNITVQGINILQGSNNIWTDGPIVSVEYHADTKLYVDKYADQISNNNAAIASANDAIQQLTENYYYAGPIPIVAVMSYNVGEWYNGTRTEMPEEDYDLYESLQKEIILKNYASILCTQEYYYLMHKDAVTSEKLFLAPSYKHNFVIDETDLTLGKSISTNLPVASNEVVSFVNAQGAGLRYQKSYIYINGHKVCVCNIHLSQLSDEYDLLQAQEVVDAVQNEEYWIVLGDFNTWFDRTEGGETGPEIINRFRAIGGKPCNCGDFGVFNTYRGSVNAPIDNIFVSSNIIIKSVYVDETKVDAEIPIPDHIPLVAYLEIL